MAGMSHGDHRGRHEVEDLVHEIFDSKGNPFTPVVKQSLCNFNTQSLTLARSATVLETYMSWSPGEGVRL
jgi:hypothetical protein